MVTIVNYGIGNIRALYNIYAGLNIKVNVASNVHELNNASKIILPGVGSFDWAMIKLDQSGFRSALDELVLEKKIPVLGICVGMQMMANGSDEGTMQGLGWFNAQVTRFEDEYNGNKIRLPHMGWNTVVNVNENGIFYELKNPNFYFLHSYYFSINDDFTIGKTTYHKEFSSAISRDNIFGVQFHPEKSHINGIKLLKNFYHL